MKTLKIIILIAAIIWLLIHTSCTKEPMNPTCFRYLELSDKYTGEMVFIRTDTLYPNGRLSNYACDSELLKLESYVPRLEGCENGYQKIRYEILK